MVNSSRVPAVGLHPHGPLADRVPCLERIYPGQVSGPRATPQASTAPNGKVSRGRKTPGGKRKPSSASASSSANSRPRTATPRTRPSSPETLPRHRIGARNSASCSGKPNLAIRLLEGWRAHPQILPRTLSDRLLASRGRCTLSVGSPILSGCGDASIDAVVHILVLASSWGPRRLPSPSGSSLL